MTLPYGLGEPLGREHLDGGTAREEGRDEVGRGAQGELKVGVVGGGGELALGMVQWRPTAR